MRSSMSGAAAARPAGGASSVGATSGGASRGASSLPVLLGVSGGMATFPRLLCFRPRGLLLRLDDLLVLLFQPLGLLGLWLLVVVGHHLFEVRALRFDAGGGHVALGDPDDGVQDRLAELVVGPVAVEVPAGASEPAGAVLVLAHPEDVLLLVLAHALTHLGVSAVR